MHSNDEIEAFYTRQAWRKCRASFLQKRRGLCEICMKNGMIVPAEHVHHKVPITPENIRDPSVTLNHENLMALCESCHQKAHRKKRWRCDPDGHVDI